MSWVAEKRQEQKTSLAVRQQQGLLVSDLVRSLYHKLRGEISRDIFEINSVYRDRYDGRLSVNEAYTDHIEVRMGANFEVLNVRLMDSGQLLEVRHQLPGMPKAIVTNYRCRLDHEDRLYLEFDGQPVPAEELSQRILAFLVE